MPATIAEKASLWLLEKAQDSVEAGAISEGMFRELCDAAKHVHGQTVKDLEQKVARLADCVTLLKKNKAAGELLIDSLNDLNKANERRAELEQQATKQTLDYYARVHTQLREAASSGSTKDVLSILKVSCLKRTRSDPPAAEPPRRGETAAHGGRRLRPRRS